MERRENYGREIHVHTWGDENKPFLSPHFVSFFVEGYCKNLSTLHKSILFYKEIIGVAVFWSY